MEPWLELRVGIASPDAGNWQRFLRDQGYRDSNGDEITVDEKFGPHTAYATRSWQRVHGLLESGVVAMVERGLAQAEGYIPFLQAKNFTSLVARPHRDVSVIVIHDMEYPETPEGAEWCAAFFAAPTAPKASAHYCLTPEARVLREDLQWIPIGLLKEGERLVATEELTPGMSGRTLQAATITRIERREAECVCVHMADGRQVTCSKDHRWLGRQPEGGGGWGWLDARWLKEGSVLCAPLQPWTRREDRLAGYVEGILDGEGCWGTAKEVTFSQKEGAVLRHTLSILDQLGVPYRQHHRKESGVTVVTLSGLQATLRIMGEVGSRRLAAEQRWIGRALRSRVYDNALQVTEVESVGTKEVVSIETSTRTFFAEGIISHNCVDSNSIVQCVRDRDVAWHAPGANHNGIGIEHAGYAKQSRKEWLDAYSSAELAISAKLVGHLLALYNIPLVKLTPDMLRAGARGICGHKDVTDAFSGGRGHQDPGPSFPWDAYLALIAIDATENPT